MPAYASNERIAAAETKLGGPIALDSSLLLKQLVVALGNVTSGGGGGSGTVTSVSVTTQNGVSATVTNSTTTPALAFTLDAITPTTVRLSGAISGTTLLQSPPIAGSAVITFPSVTGTLAIIGNPLSQFASTTSAQLAGIISDKTGSDSLVFANTPTLVAPILGTPTSGNLSNCTNIPATGVTGTLLANHGGTGLANPVDAFLELPTGVVQFFSTGAIDLQGSVLTVLASGTASLLGVAQTYTAAKTFNKAGAASTAAILLSGAILTGGTGTTNFPHLFIQPSGATAATTWNTSGTTIGVNTATGFAGRFFDFRIAGAQKAYLNASSQLLATDIQAESTFTMNASVGNGVFGMYSLATFGWGSSVVAFNTTAAGLDLVLVRKAAATLQMGLDAAGVTNQTFTAANRITSDGVGANLTIAAGNGRGGAGGTLTLSTFDTGGAGTAGTIRSRMTIDTAGAISFPVVSAVTTETVVSDTTWPVTINGVAYKICLKA